MSEKQVTKITATIFMAATTITAFTCVQNKTIGEWTFVATLAFSLGAFLVISSIGDFALFRFWNMEVKFKEIQRAEESVKELGKAIHDVFETKSHMVMQESYDSVAADAAMEKLKNLVS
jgi:hypothetical protein